jgi:putative peptidoglycan lipid II flippase
VSSGYHGDEPRRGGVSGGYGRGPRYEPASPGEEHEPDGDTASGPGDLSDLWREPDPWAAEARRGLEAWQEPAPWREDARPGPEDSHHRGDDRYRPRGDDAQRTGGYRGDQARRDDRRDYGRAYNGDEAWRDDSRRGGPVPAEDYQSPAVRRGPDHQRPDPQRPDPQRPDPQRPGRPPGEPDAPTEAVRPPTGWHELPQPPADPRPRGRTGGSQHRAGSDAWRQAPPPAGPPRRSAAPPPAEPDSTRAWWDDAFRPAADGGPGQPGPPRAPDPQVPRTPVQPPSAPSPGAPPGAPSPSAPSPSAPSPGAPSPSAPSPGAPSRAPQAAAPRRPSAQGYGVPPGELTQPIPIYQPQGTYAADAYRVAEPYGETALADTAYAPQPVFRPDQAAPGGRPAAAGSSLTRSTGSMAVGTLISRVTGFLRTFVFVFALGTATLANSYNLANTLPNAVYDVMIGGVLTSVVVPLLVKAAKDHRDSGEAYDQRIFTLSILGLGAVTVVATVAAGLLVDLYAGSVAGAEHRLTVIFAYFFIPQIFFYGLSSLIGAILNTRNSFAAPMWTPIINNVVVIAVGLLFVVTVGLHKSASTVSAGGVLLLGIGTTLGIIVQTVSLVPALRKVGFRWRPRFDFRRAELAEISHMAVWMLAYVVSTQITFVVTTRLANAASVHVPDAGVSAYNYSYALFLLPYAIIGVSVTTALLPRMSRHAAEGRYTLVRDDFSASIRLSSVILVPAALLLAVLGPPLCEFLFSYGSSSVAGARYIGEAFAAFSLGLVPFVIFQLLLRVFYALHDSRTPAVIGVLTMIATVIGNFIVAAILPAGEVVIGLAFVYGITSVFSVMIAWRLLTRRVGSLDGRVVTRSLVRMHVASIPPVIFAFAVSAAVSVVVHPGAVNGFITVLIGGGGALLLYVIVARALRLDELSQLMRMTGGRFGRRG